jgi:hypothetical protein
MLPGDRRAGGGSHHHVAAPAVSPSARAPSGDLERDGRGLSGGLPTRERERDGLQGGAPLQTRLEPHSEAPGLLGSEVRECIGVIDPRLRRGRAGAIAEVPHVRRDGLAPVVQRLEGEAPLASLGDLDVEGLVPLSLTLAARPHVELELSLGQHADSPPSQVRAHLEAHGVPAGHRRRPPLERRAGVQLGTAPGDGPDPPGDRARLGHTAEAGGQAHHLARAHPRAILINPLDEEAGGQGHPFLAEGRGEGVPGSAGARGGVARGRRWHGRGRRRRRCQTIRRRRDVGTSPLTPSGPSGACRLAGSLGPACAQRGCTASPLARRAALGAPASSPSPPLYTRPPPSTELLSVLYFLPFPASAMMQRLSRAQSGEDQHELIHPARVRGGLRKDSHEQRTT